MPLFCSSSVGNEEGKRKRGKKEWIHDHNMGNLLGGGRGALYRNKYFTIHYPAALPALSIEAHKRLCTSFSALSDRGKKPTHFHDELVLIAPYDCSLHPRPEITSRHSRPLNMSVSYLLDLGHACGTIRPRAA